MMHYKKQEISDGKDSGFLFGCGFCAIKGHQEDLFLKRMQNNQIYQEGNFYFLKKHHQTNVQMNFANNLAQQTSIKQKNVKTSIKKLLTHKKNISALYQREKFQSPVGIKTSHHLSKMQVPEDNYRKIPTNLSSHFMTNNAIQLASLDHYQEKHFHKMISPQNPKQHRQTKAQTTKAHPRIHFQLCSPQKRFQFHNLEKGFNINLNKTQHYGPNNIEQHSIYQIKTIIMKDLSANVNTNKKNELDFRQKRRIKTKLSNETHLTKDSSLKSLLHHCQTNNIQDQEDRQIQNFLQASDKSIDRSIESNRIFLKNMDDVQQIMSVADENENESDKQSIVIDRFNQFSSQLLTNQQNTIEAKKGGQSQKKVGIISAILRAQSLRFL